MKRSNPFIPFFSLACVLNMSAQPLSEKIDVEFRLPAHLNTDTALMVFDRRSTANDLSLELSFIERETRAVPAPPMDVALSGGALREVTRIDISQWPDGEYKVYIAEKGSGEAPLVRGIRKQTTEAPKAPAGPFSVEGGKVFFVDDWYLEKTAGLDRRLHPADLIPVEPWKTNPDCEAARSSIRNFWFDRNGEMNVEIHASTSANKSPRDYWAKSSDMKTWRVVHGPSPRSRDCPSVNLRRSPASEPENPVYRRYDPTTDGEVDLAQVRVRWTGTKKNAMWGEIPVPFRSRIAVWEKPGGESLLLGKPITIDKSVFGEDEIGTWADSNDNFGDVRLSPDGKRLSCYQARLIPRHDPFRVHYDNNLSDRIMVTWSTTNGIDWKPSFFDAPTLDDPWATQHYGVDMWSEENGRLQFAYHKIFDAQLQKVYTELAYSRDGIVWNRIKDGKPFLDTGARGTFNYGYSITTGNRTRMRRGDCYYEPMQCINVLHFMFLAANGKDDRSFITPAFYAQRFGGRMVGEHGVENSPIMNDYDSWDEICEVTKTQRFTPTFMRYRVDGWVGALPRKHRAEITTKVLMARGAVAINAKTAPDGFVMVEVLDSHGNDLEKYSGRNAAVFKGDRTDKALVWSGGTVKALPNEPFKLRITLEKAEIFTLEF